nr:cytochrome c biogenesis protein CcsA [uncultured Phocaeicola sp.]
MNKLKYLSFGLAGLLVLAMMTATVLEKTCGTGFAVSQVYGSPFFVAGWGIMAGCSLVYLLRRRLFRQPFSFLMHLAFLIILAGALTTHLWSRQGNLHLRAGETPVRTYVGPDMRRACFPFHLRLDTFRIEYYPGTGAVMDFVSLVDFTDQNGKRRTTGEIAMNQPFTYQHYRFYQSAYDPDGQGVTLSVAYDPWGTGITYAGYSLLLISIAGFFCQKDSRFRRLLRHPSLRHTTLCCLLVLLPVFGRAASSPQSPRTLSREAAGHLGDLYLYYHERVCPLQTLARDFTVKIYGHPRYKGLTPEQVLAGWFFYYDDWKAEPVIRIKSRKIRKRLGIDGDYAALTDFIGADGYKLDPLIRPGYTSADRREAEEADEKFNLISMVSTGSLLRIYPYRPADGSPVRWFSFSDDLPKELPDDQWLFIRNSMGLVAEQWMTGHPEEAIRLIDRIRKYQQKTASRELPSDSRFQAEKRYNLLNYTPLLALTCLTLGTGAFLYYTRRMIRAGSPNTPADRVIHAIFLGILGLVFIYLVSLIALRGYISHHLPLANGYETMQFMAACAVLLTFVCCRRWKAVVSFGYLTCGLSLLVAMLGESNPPITRLLPVLASPLLSVHVVSIMIAYTLLAFVMLNGVTALVLHHARPDNETSVERLYIISRILLYPAVFFLTTGIFIGAVWANVSWGRYWGWDPKEVWALITLLIYAGALHADSLPVFRKPLFFHGFAILAFLSVLVTYLGVNFFLGGMHSYATS